MEKKIKEKFLEIEDIGQTYITNVLLFYIYPRAFVIEDDKGNMFLLYEWTDEENWYATQISDSEYSKILSQELSLQDAFTSKQSFIIKAINDNYFVEKADVSDLLNMLPKYPIYKED